MPQAQVTFFGEQVNVKCDGNCNKAWGINNRPQRQLSDDEDDIEYLADGELGIAPQDPGTYEGGQAKPRNVFFFPNKWCVRECERCQMWDVGNDEPKMKDFSIRIKNKNK